MANKAVQGARKEDRKAKKEIRTVLLVKEGEFEYEYFTKMDVQQVLRLDR